MTNNIMTNNEAIYALEGIRNDTTGIIVMKTSEVAALDMAIEALQEKEKNRWIPVSERLPDTNDDVLVTDGVDMFVAWYSGMWQGWMSSDNNFERNTPIEAWMPLPEPYKAESEDKE